MSRHLILALALAACGNTGSSPGNHGHVDGNPGGGGGDGSLPTTDGPTSPGDGSAPAGKDPAQDGTFAVTKTDVSIKNGSVTVAATTYVPASAPSPRPLVVVSPGFQMERAQYDSYAHHMATWGFTVIAADYADKGFTADHQKNANAVQGVITWALAQPTLGVDAAKIATAGHSLGGDISFLVAADDPRVKVVIGWDPVDATSPSVTPEKMSSIHAAVAVIGETTDGAGGGMPCAPTADNFHAFYTAAASPALEMTVPTADHMDWVDDPSCFLCGLCTAGSADPTLARTATKRVDVAWLKKVFENDATMDAWLMSPPEVGAHTATVVKK